MAKSKKNVEPGKKYERQKKLSADRVKRFREKMTEEQWEEKRRKERERYYKKKELNEIKSIKDISKREQRLKRKAWRTNSKKYRAKKKNEANILNNTPPESGNELEERTVSVSLQKKRGRKNVKKDRAKVYRENEKLKKQIQDLKRKNLKYEKREQRRRNKKLEMGSPSPNSKVSQLIGKEKVSPHVKKQLFLGYALEKQVANLGSKVSPRSKENQLIKKVIGSKVLRKYRVQRYFSKIISYKYNRHNNSLQYERTLHTKSQPKVELVDKIVSFYEDDTVSKMCPGKKDFKKKGKLKMQRRILLDSLKKLHKKFQEESGVKVPYTTFCKHRPFWVTHPTSKDRDTCACIIHSNVDLLVSALSSVKAIRFKTGKDTLESIVCSIKENNCMTGNCDLCKNKKVPYLDVDDEINVKVYQWKIISEKREIKGITKVVKRMVKDKEIIKVKHAKQRLTNVLKTIFRKHVYLMIHQAQHKKNTKSALTGREIMVLLDFSENYIAKYAKEVQSMHFGASKKQISLHTVVCYYNDGEEIRPKTYCTVSDNLAHKANAVWAHLDPVLEDISKAFPQTSSIHFFSDSPSSQYRNRTNLHLFKVLLPNYFPFLNGATWNYSEAGHGKGPMDGIGGALKRRADELVLHGQDIKNASDIVKLFKKSNMTVIEISNNNVEEMKQKVPLEIPAVPKITQIKQVTLNIDENCRMTGRTQSCVKCSYNSKCEHFKLIDIFPETIYTRGRNNVKLDVDDVWSSDEEPLTAEDNVGIDLDEKPIWKKSDITVGKWVVVQYDGVTYPGEVVKVMEELVEVSVMTPTSAPNHFKWPKRVDCIPYSFEDIVKPIPPPVVVNKRGLYKCNI